MRLFGAAVSLFLAVTLPAVAQPQPHAQNTPPPTMTGFSAESAEVQRSIEAQFDAKVNRDEMREWMRRLSARPHHLSSAYDHQNAEFLASLFRGWGYDTYIEEFSVLFPTPKTRVLELVAPEHFTAKLDEPPIPGDATTDQKSEQLPTYNAYSIDGDVTGELVYVNYGLPSDYEELERRGVDVKGKIAIARYGESWRGIKPKVAAEHGAIGCIIYSDPRDDGYARGDVYPNGPFRNENGAQRGSVMDMPTASGDPLTPGIGATKDAKRLDRKDVTVFTKIPVLPISYGDALPLLRALGGPVAPPEFRGALPITYHLGAGPARVHLQLAFNWDMVPLYDVIATLRGSSAPDEWIVRGNHHDAWVNGASDPISGLVAELEEARIIGELAKNGSHPKRTIIFAAWDGEEEGLLGSTEWAETHADELRAHAIAYINSDSNGRGFLQAGGSHTLERLVTEAARDVIDPEKNVSTLQRLRAQQLSAAHGADDRRDLRERPDLRLDALGSGSDYTPFLQHLGVAALNIGYGGEASGGSYHSAYDSFDHYTRFNDGGFAYGATQARTTSRLVLRLANADILPFTFANFADTMGRYSREVAKLSDDMRAATEERNLEVREHVQELASDPKQPTIAPQLQTPVPFLNFAPLQNAIEQLRVSAREYDRAAAAATAKASTHPVGAAALDLQLMHIEQMLTSSEGLPRRPWFTHQIYAPGYYTGYGVKTMPGVREAVEQRSWNEANSEITIIANRLSAYATELDRATATASAMAK
jgi:N-acetylated-alpha-linked acidic dipeptidase